MTYTCTTTNGYAPIDDSRYHASILPPTPKCPSETLSNIIARAIILPQILFENHSV